jgi:lysozyme
MLKHGLALLTLSLVFNAVACGDAPTSTAADPTSADDALSVCAPGATLKGIDVSYYQNQIDWAAVRSAGNSFAFIRVSDGTKFEDPKFAENWSAARDAGIVRGAYQFFRASEDPVAQANLFVAKMGTLEADDLPPVLDLEVTEGVTPLSLQAKVRTWLQTVEAGTGRHPVVYTMLGMSGSVGTSFTNYPLWVANWGVSCPRMPSSWTQWKFWQSSDKGSVPGISEKVDLDTFNGTMADLQAFIAETGGGASGAGGTPTPSPPDPGTTGGTPPDPGTTGGPPPDPGTTGGGGVDPGTCTTFTYVTAGACEPDGTQALTVTSSAPPGCTGGRPLQTQGCTYVAP